MAITFKATYSKKLGLPNYSSHCFVVSLRTELSDLAQVETESARLYSLLQQSVDSQVQDVGFLPDATTYGMDGGHQPPVQRHNGNGSTTNGHAHQRNGHGSKTAANPTPDDHQNGEESNAAWNCSDKQRELIGKLSKQAKMVWEEVERLADLRFNQPVQALDRKQASILIEALLARRDEKTQATGSRSRR